DALILATHGRGFWMLDDIEPLRQLAPELGSKPVHLFTSALTWRMEGGGRRGPRRGASLEGTNPPNGAIVDFLLRDQKPGTKVSLAFLGPDGKVIRELKGEVQSEAAKPRETKLGVAPPAAAAETEAVKSEGGTAEENPSGPPKDEEENKDKLPDIANGHNRVSWDLRYPDAKKFPGMILWAGGTTGPKVLPGTYTARLTVGDQTVTAPVEVRQEPRSTASPADLKAQFDLLKSAYDKLSEVNGQIARIRDVRKSLTDYKKSDNKAISDAAKDLDKKMTAVEEMLYQTKNKSSQDPLNYPIRLNDKLAGVADSAATGFYAPTAQQIAVRDEVVAQIDAQLATLKTILDTDLPAFNKLVRDQNVPAVR
ncbi:MAG TPA: glycosyl hydrolase, partial [Thermoanaerobaculia bacterium]